MTPPAAATVAARRAVAAPPARPGRRPAATPPRPRRLSGPARPAPARPAPPARPPRPAAVPRRRPAGADLPLGARALERLRALPDHRLLDRLIGGRAWIALLGTLLVGIVTLQLTLLRLNAGIGRAVEQTSVLEQTNAALKLEISQEADANRVIAQATQMGYVMPPQGSPRFLSASAGDAARALVTMRVPDPSAAVSAPTIGSGASASTTASGVSAPAAPTPAAPTAATGVGTAAPVATSTTPATAAPTVPTPAAATTAPATAAPPAAAAGGASAPVGPQG